MSPKTHHGLLVGRTGNCHTTASILSLLGELHIYLPMILRYQTVVEVIVFDLQKDGLTIHEVTWLQEVDNFRGDEYAVRVDGLNSNEAVGNKTLSFAESAGNQL